jgi:hypothetical protein
MSSGHSKNTHTPGLLPHFIRHLRFEALAHAALMAVLLYKKNYSLLLLPVSFLVFDIGMIGYLFSKRIGAITYNFFHNHTPSILLILFGLLAEVPVSAVLGYCWSFHIAVDRLMGFGLKSHTSFFETHMGKIKK